MDSTEHVTDFQSASDHTMTLKKFQALNLPISVPSARHGDRDTVARHPKSVFEEDGDITAIDEPGQASATENKRWKFKGPWLAGMTDGEFNKWLEKSVRARRSEFQAYLKEMYAAELTEEQRSQAVRDNLPVPPKLEAHHITDAQFIAHLKDLRQDRLVLFRHVSRFLDLAPLTTDSRFMATMKYNRPQQFDKQSPYGVNGPPVTHPSAGLSYLRTHNFIDNHPVYGPQKYHPVVKARILKPRNMATGVHEPIIGVAGFIADRPVDQRILGRGIQSTPRGRALAYLELEQKGGTKLYYNLDSATIDSTGKVRIGISDPGNPFTELVAKELRGEDGMKTELYESSLEDSSATEVPRNPMSQPPRRAAPIFGSKESYGFGLDS